MDRSDVITLVGTTLAQNDFGVWTDTEEQKDVLCSVESVTRAEYFEGGKNGLVPEYKFVIFFDDYSGEKTVLYKGVAYGIYRTFRAKTDRLELYTERKGGVNAVVTDD